MFLLAISVPCRFTLEVLQKSKVEELWFEPRATLWQCVSTCLKRGLQKVVIKPIEYWLLRCSGLHMCPHVSLAAAYLFFTKLKKTGPGATLFRRRSSIWKVLRGIWTDAHRCLLKNASLIVSRTFNGIDEIIWRFIAKVYRPKAFKIKLNLSMPKRTPKRRSPNIGERKLKLAITVRRPQISLKCNKIWDSKLTASPNTSSSECAIFR